jgi:predicted nucleic acid-binding protein
MIAATAIANGLTVHTCNRSDFSDTDELDLVAVRHPDHSSTAS